jgi:hypothetical protein
MQIFHSYLSCTRKILPGQRAFIFLHGNDILPCVCAFVYDLSIRVSCLISIVRKPSLSN